MSELRGVLGLMTSRRAERRGLMTSSDGELRGEVFKEDEEDSALLRGWA